MRANPDLMILIAYIGLTAFIGWSIDYAASLIFNCQKKGHRE